MIEHLKERLHLRLALVIALVGTIVSIVGSFVVFELSQAKHREFSELLLNQIAASSAKTAAISVYVDDKELAREIIGSLEISDLVLAAQISNEQQVIARSMITGLDIEPIVLQLPHPFIDTEFIGKLAVYPDNTFIQRLAVADAQSSVWQMLLVSLCLTLTIYIVIFRFLSRPLIQLSSAFEEVDPSLPERLKKIEIHYQKKDEIGFLIGGINRLIHAVRINFVAECKLRMRTEKLEQQFRLLFDKASVGICLLSTKKGILIENPVFNSFVGDIVSTKSLIEFFEDSAAVSKAIGSIKSTSNSKPIAMDLAYKLGEERRWVHCLFAAVSDQRVVSRDNDDVLIEVIVNDITDRKEREAEIRYQAQHDPLTGLYNRLGGETRLQGLLTAQENNQSTLYMLIDLDKFKPINDTYGHDAGDIVLTEVSYRIKTLFNDPTDICCRWGGDEFVIGFQRERLLQSALETLCNTLLHSLEEPVAIGPDTSVTVSASIGVVIVSEPDKDIEYWVGKADQAMYDVKKQGRANFIVV